MFNVSMYAMWSRSGVGPIFRIWGWKCGIGQWITVSRDVNSPILAYYRWRGYHRHVVTTGRCHMSHSQWNDKCIAKQISGSFDSAVASVGLHEGQNLFGAVRIDYSLKSLWCDSWNRTAILLKSNYRHWFKNRHMSAWTWWTFANHHFSFIFADFFSSYVIQSKFKSSLSKFFVLLRFSTQSSCWKSPVI